METNIGLNHTSRPSSKAHFIALASHKVRKETPQKIYNSRKKKEQRRNIFGPLFFFGT